MPAKNAITAGFQGDANKIVFLANQNSTYCHQFKTLSDLHFPPFLKISFFLSTLFHLSSIHKNLVASKKDEVVQIPKMSLQFYERHRTVSENNHQLGRPHVKCNSSGRKLEKGF